jgi:glycine/D-amino acid oxidase-like deaminating enzyme
MRAVLDRRHLLKGSAAVAAAGLAGCTTLPRSGAVRDYNTVAPLAPVWARVDRLFDITVCLRPFRAAGPRLDAEQVGDKLVVHNYGHGGSGWSLSWGSGTLAVRKAMANSPRQIAVIGCGALGLTSAILAQEAGADVTIYAKDLLPDTRSARATGTWTPDSRIALTNAAPPEFAAQWEEMARISFHRYRRYLGLPGNPVEWFDRYTLLDTAPGEAPQADDPLGFASYSDRIRDLMPRGEELAEGSTPFPVQHVRRNAQMKFNIADYGHTLLSDFHGAGGRFIHAEFDTLGDFTRLKEKVIINCTGYGARALCKDESVVPVRGQIGWLIPQPEVTYGVFYAGVSMLARRDGIVVQVLQGGDMRGYNDDHEVVDRAESEDAVRVLADLYSRFRV